MFFEIAKEILFNSVGYILPFVKKQLYKQEEFEKDVTFEVEKSQIEAILDQGNQSRLEFFLKIRNQSQYLDTTFEKASLTLTSEYNGSIILLGYPVINEDTIKKKESRLISIRCLLNESQIKLLESLNETKHPNTNLQAEYWISSKMYSLRREAYLHQINCKVRK